MRSIVLISLLGIAALSGCISDDDSPGSSTNSYQAEKTGILPSDLTLVHGESKKSLAPHPAYGYPTYTDYSGLTVDVPTSWVPPQYNELPESVTGFEHLATVDNVSAGAGIAVFGKYAYISGNGPGAIVDIEDPANPIKVAHLNSSMRDADLVAYPDGQLVMVAAVGSSGIALWDVTNPMMPVQLESIAIGSHNAAVVPGTPIVYNSNSAGGSATGIAGPDAAVPETASGVTEIYDLTDAESPVLLSTFENGYGCHDITFFIDEENDKYRAYCAGIEMTQIWDIADPTNPVVLVNIPVHHGVVGTPSSSVPPVLFSHLAMVDADGDTLIVGDESGGGLANACDANVEAPGQTAAGPTGNLWFYDITDEMNPVFKSMMNPNNPATQSDYQDTAANNAQGSATAISEDPTSATGQAGSNIPAGCTAHFGRLIEDKDQLVISFYGAGILIVDFSDVANPLIVDQYAEGSNTWDVWEHQGYVITGDLSRGVDILRLV